MVLNDNETKKDFLNYEAISNTIAKLIVESPNSQMTIGVHGDWGAGKSSILEMIEDELSSKEGVLCIKFNSWRFQGFEDAKMSLIEGIVASLVEKKPFLKKAAGALSNLIKRIDWLKIAKKAGGLAFTAYTGIPSPELAQSLISTARGWLEDPAKLATSSNIQTLLDRLGELVKPVETKHVPEEISEFREAFNNLLKEAEIARLVVLIDDLDRCLPETAIETLEAIKLFLLTEKTVFVVAADEGMIEYAVRKHFPELPDMIGSQDYARNYLEKLIQVPFRIPALGEMETRIYILLLLLGSKLGDDDQEFNNLVIEARKRLKSPWLSTAIDSSTLRKILGNKMGLVQEMFALSDQIGPILANGSNGNPRQIKRFLNTLLLRQEIASVRGFGADIKLPVLAKLMLAERFIPKLFELLATSAASNAEGNFKEIEEVENKKKNKGKTIKIEKGLKEGDKKEEQYILGLPPSDTIKSWCNLEPYLSDIDLRPYLFIVKDRKDYFGSKSALGKLSSIVDSLMGALINVKGLVFSLRELNLTEAEEVFEGVRSRIMAKGEFNSKPQGVDGLAVLITAQPKLESNLLEFLDTLPTIGLGSWVCNGWESAIISPSGRDRFSELLKKWSAETSNKMLSSVSTTLLKTIL